MTRRHRAPPGCPFRTFGEEHSHACITAETSLPRESGDSRLPSGGALLDPSQQWAPAPRCPAVGRSAPKGAAPVTGRQPLSGASVRVPGRKLGPIIDRVGVSHRAWLQVLRERYFVSGLTIAALARQSGWSKSKVSELLRGAGLYPTWELTHSLVHVLGLPTRPMQLLWCEAAADAGKKPDWIEGCISKVVVATGGLRPPLEHRAFTELYRPGYTAYGKVFLPTGAEARRAVAEALVILWMRWDEALVSSGAAQFAWPILRWSVMARAPHTADHHPELTPAAFDTVALARAVGPGDQFRQFEESLNLFQAISRLPDLELDVTVLVHLRGMDTAAVADLLGLPPSLITLTDERARRSLAIALAPHSLGGTP
ncbi:conserved hypothetical protein [Streptomyces clavuligerus]|nr:conserved hypothetical protein [Streptomyces clavuligerus]